jgi:hypothetical protein
VGLPTTIEVNLLYHAIPSDNKVFEQVLIFEYQHWSSLFKMACKIVIYLALTPNCQLESLVTSFVPAWSCSSSKLSFNYLALNSQLLSAHRVLVFQNCGSVARVSRVSQGDRRLASSKFQYSLVRIERV